MITIPPYWKFARVYAMIATAGIMTIEPAIQNGGKGGQFKNIGEKENRGGRG